MVDVADGNRRKAYWCACGHLVATDKPSTRSPLEMNRIHRWNKLNIRNIKMRTSK